MNTTIPESLRAEIAAYQQQVEDLQKHHAGKFVIFRDGELQGVFDTFDAAGREAIRLFGDGPYLIRQVGPARVMPLPASVAFRPIHTAQVHRLMA